jgi:uncharacterized membrane protein YphA (DoxX/SURF4 family)
VSTLAAVVLGLVLLASGALKVAGWAAWRRQAAMLGVPFAVASAVPAAELALGALLVVGLWRSAAAWLAGALLLGFTVFLVAVLRTGQRPPCACFGSLSRRPIGWWSVVRNLVLLGLAVVVVV